MTMTLGRSLTLALISGLVLFFAGLYVGSRPRVCTMALSVSGWVPVCSNTFAKQMGN